MSRVLDHINAIYNWLSELEYEGSKFVNTIRKQLDLVDIEDVTRLSFKTPAVFIVLPNFSINPRIDGAYDCELDLVFAIVVRSEVGIEADALAIDKAIFLSQQLTFQDFGQICCSSVSSIKCRPVFQSSLENKGVAIVGISCKQILYNITPAIEAVLAPVFNEIPTSSDQIAQEISIQLADEDLSSSEQQVIAGWSKP